MEPSPGRRDAGVGLLWGVSDTALTPGEGDVDVCVLVPVVSPDTPDTHNLTS